MNLVSLLRRFSPIRTFKRGELEAPHKTLVLLTALAHGKTGTLPYFPGDVKG
jgi:hypothetical protein